MQSTVIHLDGTTYHLESEGVVLRDFVVESPQYETELQTVAGGIGAADLGTTIDTRPITASYYVKADDNLEDFTRRRDFVFNAFRSRLPFYIIDGRQRDKRWRVKVNGGFALDQQYKYGFFEVPLIALDGVSETINVVSRRFDTATFDYDNGGTVEIDPRQQSETAITFAGASDGLTLINHTTGDEWAYNGQTVAGDEIELRGVRSLKNGASIFRDTNKRVITFAPGRNEIEVVGATGEFEIEISTRFYFL